jgi:hypothetical protein
LTAHAAELCPGARPRLPLTHGTLEALRRKDHHINA